MPNLSPRCCSFFESDSEYPDLDCQKLAAKRYLRLIFSADYRLRPYIDAVDGENLPLPANIITIGRRMNSYTKVKILRALEIYPVKCQIRVYQLFWEVKDLGFRYNVNLQNWEFCSAS